MERIEERKQTTLPKCCPPLEPAVHIATILASEFEINTGLVGDGMRSAIRDGSVGRWVGWLGGAY